MSTLRQGLAFYLELRRSLGFKLARPEKLLGQFVSYCEAAGAEVVTTELALAWATLPERASREWAAYRLSVVRCFARHLAYVDERTEVPPADLLPARGHRVSPYLYSEDQVRSLMAAAQGCFPSPLRKATFSTVVGLLYVSGMRVGEVLRLDRADVDFMNNFVLVRRSKFNKSRELPLHSSTAAALCDYARLRDRTFPVPKSGSFFVSLAGTRLLYCNFHFGFLAMVAAAGIARRSAACRPRPHDLRHSFAVSTLVSWYQEGADVEARLPQLSTYLGHVHPANTYWYLSAAPELMALAAALLEATEGARP